MSGQEPDPLEVVLDPAVDEEHADEGRYRGRRRFGKPARRAKPPGRGTARRAKPARRWAPALGASSVLAAIGILLVGSGLLVRTLATAQPDDLPLVPPSPSAAPHALDDRAAAGDRSDRPAPGTRSSPTSSPDATANAPEDPAGPPAAERGESGNNPAAGPDPDEPADPAGPPAREPSFAPQAACLVDVALDRWADGYAVNFRITNQGPPFDGWTMTFTVPAGVRLDEGWNGQWSQQGTTMTVTNAPFNAAVGTGQSVSTGHRGSDDGEVSFTGFTVNDAACTTS